MKQKTYLIFSPLLILSLGASCMASEAVLIAPKTEESKTILNYAFPKEYCIQGDLERLKIYFSCNPKLNNEDFHVLLTIAYNKKHEDIAKLLMRELQARNPNYIITYAAEGLKFKLYPKGPYA